MTKRGVHLPLWEYRALDLACRPLSEAFTWGVFLVGSCMVHANYRDVDVRAMMNDEEFTNMFPGIDPRKPRDNARWVMVCMGISLYLKQCSGLPIDFQIQDTTVANEENDGQRSALGIGGA